MKQVYIPASLTSFVFVKMVASNIAVQELSSFFDTSANKVFWPSDLSDIFVRYRTAWKIPRSMKFPAFTEFLLHHTKLKELKLRCAKYSSPLRYTWGDVSPVSVALSTNRHAYLSHASGLWVHGLGGNARQLYVNHEQSEKPQNDGQLTQEATDRVFRNQPRHSKLIYELSGTKIVVLNGKFTGQLGVEKLLSPTGESVDVTCLERTLIDVTVRPQYAGGVLRVIDAFAAARGRVSIRKLVRMLKTLDHTYPYHQAIGFYLKRSGYGAEDQTSLKGIGLRLDFYLSYGLSNPLFDPGWRIWYPRTLGQKRETLPVPWEPLVEKLGSWSVLARTCLAFFGM
jgi:hypothetical protein